MTKLINILKNSIKKFISVVFRIIGKSVSILLTFFIRCLRPFIRFFVKYNYFKRLNKVLRRIFVKALRKLKKIIRYFYFFFKEPFFRILKDMHRYLLIRYSFYRILRLQVNLWIYYTNYAIKWIKGFIPLYWLAVKSTGTNDPVILKRTSIYWKAFSQLEMLHPEVGPENIDLGWFDEELYEEELTEIFKDYPDLNGRYYSVGFEFSMLENDITPVVSERMEYTSNYYFLREEEEEEFESSPVIRSVKKHAFRVQYAGYNKIKDFYFLKQIPLNRLAVKKELAVQQKAFYPLKEYRLAIGGPKLGSTIRFQKASRMLRSLSKRFYFKEVQSLLPSHYWRREWGVLYAFHNLIRIPFYKELSLKKEYLFLEKNLAGHIAILDNFSLFNYSDEKEANSMISRWTNAIRSVAESRHLLSSTSLAEKPCINEKLLGFAHEKIHFLKGQRNILVEFFQKKSYHKMWSHNFGGDSFFYTFRSRAFGLYGTDAVDYMSIHPGIHPEFVDFVSTSDVENYTKVRAKLPFYRPFLEETSQLANVQIPNPHLLVSSNYFANITHPSWLHFFHQNGVSPFDVRLGKALEIPNTLYIYNATKESQRKRLPVHAHLINEMIEIYDHESEYGFLIGGAIASLLTLMSYSVVEMGSFKLNGIIYHMGPILKDWGEFPRFGLDNALSVDADWHRFGEGPFDLMTAHGYQYNYLDFHKRRFYHMWDKRRLTRGAGPHKTRQTHSLLSQSNNEIYRRRLNFPKIVRDKGNALPSFSGFALSPERWVKKNSEALALYSNNHSLSITNEHDLYSFKKAFPFSNYSDFVDEMSYYSLPSQQMGDQGFLDIPSQAMGPYISKLEALQLWAIQYKLGLFHLQPWVSDEMQALLSTVIPTLSFWRSHSGRRRRRRLYYKRRFQFVPFSRDLHPKSLDFFSPLFSNFIANQARIQNPNYRVLKFLINLHHTPNLLDSYYHLLSQANLRKLSLSNLFPTGFKPHDAYRFFVFPKLETYFPVSIYKNRLEQMSSLLLLQQYLPFTRSLRRTNRNELNPQSQVSNSLTRYFKKISNSLYWDQTGTSTTDYKLLPFTPRTQYFHRSLTKDKIPYHYAPHLLVRNSPFQIDPSSFRSLMDKLDFSDLPWPRASVPKLVELDIVYSFFNLARALFSKSVSIDNDTLEALVNLSGRWKSRKLKYLHARKPIDPETLRDKELKRIEKDYPDFYKIVQLSKRMVASMVEEAKLRKDTKKLGDVLRMKMIVRNDEDTLLNMVKNLEREEPERSNKGVPRYLSLLHHFKDSTIASRRFSSTFSFQRYKDYLIQYLIARLVTSRLRDNMYYRLTFGNKSRYYKNLFSSLLNDNATQERAFHKVLLFCYKLALKDVSLSPTPILKPVGSVQNLVRTRNFLLKNKVKTQHLDFSFSGRFRKKHFSLLETKEQPLLSFLLNRLTHFNRIFTSRNKSITVLGGLRGTKGYERFFSPSIRPKLKNLQHKPQIYNYYWSRYRVKRSFFPRTNRGGFIFRHFLNPTIGKKAAAFLDRGLSEQREKARLSDITETNRPWYARQYELPSYIPWYLRRYIFRMVRTNSERYGEDFKREFENYLLDDYYLKQYQFPNSILRQNRSSLFARRYSLNYLRNFDKHWTNAHKRFSSTDLRAHLGLEGAYKWDEVEPLISSPPFQNENWYSKIHGRGTLFLSKRLFRKDASGLYKKLLPYSHVLQKEVPWKESDFTYSNRFLDDSKPSYNNEVHYPIPFGIRTATGPNLFSSRVFYLPMARHTSIHGVRRHFFKNRKVSFVRYQFHRLGNTLHRLLSDNLLQTRVGRLVQYIVPLSYFESNGMSSTRIESFNRTVRTSLRKWIRGRHLRSPESMELRFRNDIRHARLFLNHIPYYFKSDIKDSSILHRSLLSKLLKKLKADSMLRVDAYLRSVSPSWKKISYLRNSRLLYNKLQNYSFPPRFVRPYFRFRGRKNKRMKAFGLSDHDISTAYHQPGRLTMPVDFMSPKTKFRGLRRKDLLFESNKYNSSRWHSSIANGLLPNELLEQMRKHHPRVLEDMYLLRFLAPRADYEEIQRDIFKRLYKQPIVRRRGLLFKKANFFRKNYFLGNLSRSIHPRAHFEAHFRRTRRLFKSNLKRRNYFFPLFDNLPAGKTKRVGWLFAEDEDEEDNPSDLDLDANEQRPENAGWSSIQKGLVFQEPYGIISKFVFKLLNPQSEITWDLPESHASMGFSNMLRAGHAMYGRNQNVSWLRRGRDRLVISQPVRSTIRYIFGRPEKRNAVNLRHVLLRKKYQYWFKNTPISAEGDTYLDAALRSKLHKFYLNGNMRSSYLGKAHASVEHVGPLRSYWRKNTYSRPASFLDPSRNDKDRTFLIRRFLPYLARNFSSPLNGRDNFRFLLVGRNRLRINAFPFSHSYKLKNYRNSDDVIKKEKFLRHIIRNSIPSRTALGPFFRRFQYEQGSSEPKMRSFESVADTTGIQKKSSSWYDMKKMAEEDTFRGPVIDIFNMEFHRWSKMAKLVMSMVSRAPFMHQFHLASNRNYVNRPYFWWGRRSSGAYKDVLRHISLKLKLPYKVYRSSISPILNRFSLLTWSPEIEKNRHRPVFFIRSLFSFRNPGYFPHMARLFAYKKRYTTPFKDRFYKFNIKPYGYRYIIGHWAGGRRRRGDTYFEVPFARNNFYITPFHFRNPMEKRPYVYRRKLHRLWRRIKFHFVRKSMYYSALTKYFYRTRPLVSKVRFRPFKVTSEQERRRKLFHKRWLQQFRLNRLSNILGHSKPYFSSFALDSDFDSRLRGLDLKLASFFKSEEPLSKNNLFDRHKIASKKLKFRFVPFSLDAKFKQSFVYHPYEYKTQTLLAWYRNPIITRYRNPSLQLLHGTRFYPYKKIHASKRKAVIRRFNYALSFLRAKYVKLRRSRLKKYSLRAVNRNLAFSREESHAKNLLNGINTSLFSPPPYKGKNRRLLAKTTAYPGRFFKRLFVNRIVRRMKGKQREDLLGIDDFIEDSDNSDSEYSMYKERFNVALANLRKLKRARRIFHSRYNRRGPIHRSLYFAPPYASYDSGHRMRFARFFFSLKMPSLSEPVVPPMSVFESLRWYRHKGTKSLESLESLSVNRQLRNQYARLKDFKFLLYGIDNRLTPSFFSEERRFPRLSNIFFKRFFFDYGKQEYLVPEYNLLRKPNSVKYVPYNSSASIGRLEGFFGHRLHKLKQKYAEAKSRTLLSSLNKYSTREMVGRAALKTLHDRYYSKKRADFKKEFLSSRFIYPAFYSLPKVFIVPAYRFLLPILKFTHPSRYYYDEETIWKRNLNNNYFVTRRKSKHEMTQFGFRAWRALEPLLMHKTLRQLRTRIIIRYNDMIAYLPGRSKYDNFFTYFQGKGKSKTFLDPAAKTPQYWGLKRFNESDRILRFAKARESSFLKKRLNDYGSYAEKKIPFLIENMVRDTFKVPYPFSIYRYLIYDYKNKFVPGQYRYEAEPEEMPRFWTILKRSWPKLTTLKPKERRFDFGKKGNPAVRAYEKYLEWISLARNISDFLNINVLGQPTYWKGRAAVGRKIMLARAAYRSWERTSYPFLRYKHPELPLEYVTFKSKSGRARRRRQRKFIFPHQGRKSGLSTFKDIMTSKIRYKKRPPGRRPFFRWSQVIKGIPLSVQLFYQYFYKYKLRQLGLGRRAKFGALRDEKQILDKWTEYKKNLYGQMSEGYGSVVNWIPARINLLRIIPNRKRRKAIAAENRISNFDIALLMAMGDSVVTARDRFFDRISREIFSAKSDPFSNGVAGHYRKHILSRTQTQSVPLFGTRRYRYGRPGISSNPFLVDHAKEVNGLPLFVKIAEKAIETNRIKDAHYTRLVKPREYFLFPRRLLFVNTIKNLRFPHIYFKKPSWSPYMGFRRHRSTRAYFWSWFYKIYRTKEQPTLTQLVYHFFFNPIQRYAKAKALKHKESRKMDSYLYKGKLIQHILRERNNFNFNKNMLYIRSLVDKAANSFYNFDSNFVLPNPNTMFEGPFRRYLSTHRLKKRKINYVRENTLVRSAILFYGLHWPNSSQPLGRRKDLRSFETLGSRYGAFLNSLRLMSRDIPYSERNVSHLLADRLNLFNYKNNFRMPSSRALAFHEYYKHFPRLGNLSESETNKIVANFMSLFHNFLSVQSYLSWSALARLYGYKYLYNPILVPGRVRLGRILDFLDKLTVEIILENYVWRETLRTIYRRWYRAKAAMNWDPEEKSLVPVFYAWPWRKESVSYAKEAYWDPKAREIKPKVKFLPNIRPHFVGKLIAKGISLFSGDPNGFLTWEVGPNPITAYFKKLIHPAPYMRTVYRSIKRFYYINKWKRKPLPNYRARKPIARLHMDPGRYMRYWSKIPTSPLSPGKSILDQLVDEWVFPYFQPYTDPFFNTKYFRPRDILNSIETFLQNHSLMDSSNRKEVDENTSSNEISAQEFYSQSKRFLTFKTHYYSLKRWYAIYGNKKVGSYSLLSWRVHKRMLSELARHSENLHFKYKYFKNRSLEHLNNVHFSFPDLFKAKYNQFLKERVKALFQAQDRSMFLDKKALVVASRNLVRERRNLQYKESYRKYKPYFVKPSILWKDNYSTYIDYIHETQFLPLFNIKKEVQLIERNKLEMYHTNLDFHSDQLPDWRKKLRFFYNFFYDFYYEVVVDFHIWFPFYDVYSALSFLF